MDRAEFDSFRERHVRNRRIAWWLIVAACVVLGYWISLLATLLVGALATVASIAAIQPVFLRWDRAVWLKRFPELGDETRFKWQRRSW
jgi:hypothetical protein